LKLLEVHTNKAIPKSFEIEKKITLHVEHQVHCSKTKTGQRLLPRSLLVVRHIFRLVGHYSLACVFEYLIQFVLYVLIGVFRCAYCSKIVKGSAVAGCDHCSTQDMICKHEKQLSFHKTQTKKQKSNSSPSFNLSLNYGCFERFHSKKGFDESYYNHLLKTKNGEVTGKYALPAWIRELDKVWSFVLLHDRIAYTYTYIYHNYQHFIHIYMSLRHYSYLDINLFYLCCRTTRS
jgi:hypothetical protein